jgi:hypothetical protein
MSAGGCDLLTIRSLMQCHPLDFSKKRTWDEEESRQAALTLRAQYPYRPGIMVYTSKGFAAA